MVSPPVQDASQPPRRPRGIHVAEIAAMFVIGGLLCSLVYWVERRWWTPMAIPAARDVTFDVVVLDAGAGTPIAGAEVGIEEETGEFDPPGPDWKGTTDARGRIRVVHRFQAHTMVGQDGKIRGRVVFNRASGIHSFSSSLVVKAPGHGELVVDLVARYPRGIDFEDPSALPITVTLVSGSPH